MKPIKFPHVKIFYFHWNFSDTMPHTLVTLSKSSDQNLLSSVPP